jgi:nucleoside-diphosphate-sugar epimerase
MKLFVTGGTGFVGTHFIGQAIDAGHDILALRRPGSRARLPLTVEPMWLEKSMEQVTAADLAGIDALVHLAAHSANIPYDTLENCMQLNVLVPLQLCRTALAADVHRFIMAGSCFEYGRAAERYDFIPIDAPLEPTASYPTSKAAASVAFVGFAQESAIRLSVLRIFQVFGRGELETRFWPTLKRAAQAGKDFPMTAGEQIRDFVLVEDVARQFVAELCRVVPPGCPEIRHVGTGNPVTLRAFAEYWWGEWKAKGKLVFGAVPYRPGEVMRIVPKI